MKKYRWYCTVRMANGKDYLQLVEVESPSLIMSRQDARDKCKQLHRSKYSALSERVVAVTIDGIHNQHGGEAVT